MMRITFQIPIIICAVLGMAEAQLSSTGPGGIEIQMDTASGAFAVGDTLGRRITFNFNYPWSRGGNFLVFAVDDSGYTNMFGETRYGFNYIRIYPGEARYYLGTLSRDWRVSYGAGEFYFQISVTPVELNGAGMAKVVLYMFNGDAIPHDFGAMIGIDLKIGSNDRARFATGTSVLTEGTLLRDSDIPHFWQAFEVSPGAGCDQVIGRGYLKGLDATPPDRFALGDLYFLQMSPWEIDTTFVGQPYYDSAILMRWAKRRVNPDKDVKFVTYIGFGRCVPPDEEILLMPLIPSRLRPMCDGVESPFEAAVLVHNVSLDSGLTDGTVCIHIPPGTSLETDPLHPGDSCLSLAASPMLPGSSEVKSWLVNVDDTALWGDSIRITVSLTGEPAVFQECTSYVWVPDPDGNQPVCDMNLFYHSTACPDSEPIYIPFYLHDDTGIDTYSVAVKVGNAVLTALSGYFLFVGDSLYVRIPPYLLTHGETLEVKLISVTDIYGCSPPDFPPPETILVDRQPPILVGFDPPDAHPIDTIPRVRIIFSDDVTGIDQSSLDLIVDGEHISPDDPRISWESDSVVIFTADETYPDGYPLTVCVMSIADRTDRCGPNVRDIPQCVTYTVSAIADRRPPELPAFVVQPNPFNSACSIRFQTSEPAELTISDVRGKVVLTRRFPKPGDHAFWWKPRGIPGGIYLISVNSGKSVSAFKVLYLP